MKDNGDHPTKGVHPTITPPDLSPTTVVFGRITPRCQFWRRATGVQCRKASLKDRKFCRRHRGNIVAIGALNPAFKHGRWSILLPANLRASSPPSFSHRNEILLCDDRLETLVRKIASGSESFGGGLREIFERLHGAMLGSDSDGIRAAMTDLRALSYSTTATDRTWEQVMETIDQRARLVDAERRFGLNMMSRESAVTIAHALIAAVTKHVPDRAVIKSIIGEIRAVVDRTEDAS